MKTSICRFCGEKLFQNFLDLGMSPLSNAYLDEVQITQKEAFFPLHVFVCEKCLLVQLEEFESPKNIFSNYAYFSSYSKTWLEHAEKYVQMMISRFNLNQKNFVIEIASNDGYLLQYFKKESIPILGIEPATNISKIANEKGIPTVTEFFNKKFANELLKSKKHADVIIGNNVLAHVPDLNDFISGLKILLKSNGVITLEFPHILELINQNQFDTIYHEHFSYFSLIVLEKIFEFHNLVIVDVEQLSTHGGSLRIFVKHRNEKADISDNVKKLINLEKKFGLDNVETYTKFQKTIETLKEEIVKFFNLVKDKNKTVVGYGAAAKGNTLLNFCDIGNEFIEYVVDNNPHKQGMYLPGTHIPIKDPQILTETKPDYLIIFPWNLKNEIIEQTNFIREWGGKHVTLIPDVRILE